MKKFGKFLFGALSLAALAGGAFYFLKNVVNKDTDDDFEDFEDDFEDFDTDDDDLNLNGTENREYVPINLTESSDSENDSAEALQTEDSPVSEDSDDSLTDAE